MVDSKGRRVHLAGFFLRFWRGFYDTGHLGRHFAGYGGFDLTIFPDDVGSDGPYSLNTGNCARYSSRTAIHGKIWGVFNPLSV